MGKQSIIYLCLELNLSNTEFQIYISIRNEYMNKFWKTTDEWVVKTTVNSLIQFLFICCYSKNVSNFLKKVNRDRQFLIKSCQQWKRGKFKIAFNADCNVSLVDIDDHWFL